MAKKMLIDATHAEETRVVVVDGNKVEEFDFESENKRQLAGNIYLAKVTRVEPSLQAAFVDYGGNRHGFLAFSEIHPDYYQIPVADREALLEEERAYAEQQRAREDDDEKPKKSSRRSSSRSKAAKAKSDDAVTSSEDISGMETIELDEAAEDSGDGEGLSPMETVAETPVEEPADDAGAQDAKDAGAATSEDQTAEGDSASSDDNGHDDHGHEDHGHDEHSHENNGNGSGKGRSSSKRSDAAAKDDTIESVADDDDTDDIRAPRKPRPRRYKIQEVIKVRQILLVQVVKEERGNKGAALTTYLSLAGRYCVLMPNTARGGGISRKITNAADRKKLKEIATEIDVPTGAGLIIRTAGAKRTKSEIKRDYEYLQRLWEQIRELTLKSIAPAKIYEEGNLIKRSIRDLYNREIDEVMVEGEAGYRVAKDFMKMIMPSHAKNVKHYIDPMPLFARYQVESYLSSMFNPTVQLKSGGYIVIGVTEALVAIDVNSGRATKEGSIEETATKTNLEAAEEVARQLRLRDLAGLIVIDFIDMDERKNNNAVEKKLKDKLKSDRARIQVGRISGFGLLEMSRQRLRPGMIEATTQACPACHGTGLIRSDDNLALSILRQIEEEGVRRRSREVLVKCPVGIANFLMNQKREHVAQIEGRYGLSVRIEGDPVLISPDFSIDKFKTATRHVPEAAPVVSVDSSLMEEVEAEIPDEEETSSDASSDETTTSGGGDDDGKPKKRRRRRRRRSKSRSGNGEGSANGEGQNNEDGSSESGTGSEDGAKPEADAEADAEKASESKPDEAVTAEVSGEDTEKAEKPKRTRKPRSSSKSKAKAEETSEDTAEAKTEEPAAEAPAEEAKPEAVEIAAEEKPAKPAPKRASRSRSKKAEPAPEPETETAPKPEAVAESAAATAEEPAPAPEPEQAAEPAPAPAEPESAPEPKREPEPANASAEPAEEESDKPKRRGWWSIGR
ncbi:Rne/Rng family ribonuclease [Roseovarius indicus]|uniref:Ribonuclease E n=1 Tax=Roseovarius indicus TaxID=540747 RepID=A0A0T5PAS5_9RHOB|nr:ribonuclease E/G [Roseovarius indicus]KRS18259.1 ribonuclease [Roseovarius indicus]QEW26903.1 Ribonuclease E [Roseovarius indicus]SFD58122.1 RNAse E [Roseovarius indicus]